MKTLLNKLNKKLINCFTGPDRRLRWISSHLFGGRQSFFHSSRILSKLTSGYGFTAFALLYFGWEQD